MIYKVHMLAFMDGEIREVDVPDTVDQSTDSVLELIFMYGQNDFQPLPDRCSVSMGDVAEVDGQFFLCQAMGWKQLTEAEFEAYKKVERRDRQFLALVCN